MQSVKFPLVERLVGFLKSMKVFELFMFLQVSGQLKHLAGIILWIRLFAFRFVL